MSKARPKIPGRYPNTAGDRAPTLGNARPSERDPIYREIAEEILAEWARVAASPGAQLDREALQAAISAKLRLAPATVDGQGGDPMGEVEVGIVVDPPPEAGRKFVWVVIPYPEAPQGEDLGAWIQNYQNSPQLKLQLGEAILFGCGR